MLEEGSHRNFAFTMFHADQMPKVAWGVVEVKSLAEGLSLWQLTVEVANEKIIPTILAMARQKEIGARDSITCVPGEGAEVVASGTVSSLVRRVKLEAVERNPERIFNDRGIPGRGHRLFRFIISGQGACELTYFSQKGGTITQTVELTETPIPAPTEKH